MSASVGALSCERSPARAGADEEGALCLPTREAQGSMSTWTGGWRGQSSHLYQSLRDFLHAAGHRPSASDRRATMNHGTGARKAGRAVAEGLGGRGRKGSALQDGLHLLLQPGQPSAAIPAPTPALACCRPLSLCSHSCYLVSLSPAVALHSPHIPQPQKQSFDDAKAAFYSPP